MNWKKVYVKKRPHLPMVGEYVESVLSEIVSDQKMEYIATIQSLWVDIVGDQIASVAKPLSFQNGTLTIQVKSAAWRQELASQIVTIQRAIHKNLPEISVENIIFR